MLTLISASFSLLLFVRIRNDCTLCFHMLIQFVFWYRHLSSLQFIIQQARTQLGIFKGSINRCLLFLCEERSWSSQRIEFRHALFLAKESNELLYSSDRDAIHRSQF